MFASKLVLINATYYQDYYYEISLKIKIDYQGTLLHYVNKTIKTLSKGPEP